ncbi:hypothetical protein DPMN_193865 [Dreissena polymorpha]|uniref:Uncharacterized protein n=1 Tax=Dreissena polymorpha TaxID=45954 RepID=A0A9D3Y5M7_DREPO|nr:hypothetical protein DPMN_193865 [Dreissena polymorpha]
MFDNYTCTPCTYGLTCLAHRFLIASRHAQCSSALCGCSRSPPPSNTGFPVRECRFSELWKKTVELHCAAHAWPSPHKAHAVTLTPRRAHCSLKPGRTFALTRRSHNPHVYASVGIAPWNVFLAPLPSSTRWTATPPPRAPLARRV